MAITTYADLDFARLRDFITESNRIDGRRYQRGRRQKMACSDVELDAWARLLDCEQVTVTDVVQLVRQCEPDARLRNVAGLQCRVGADKMPAGGAEIEADLVALLSHIDRGTDPYGCHQEYLDIHPFTACNGHSGRALWLWQMVHQRPDELAEIVQHLGTWAFLQPWYFHSLEAARR